MSYPRMASLKTAADFRRHVDGLAIPIPFDEAVAFGPNSPLGRPCNYRGGSVGNRFCILPMEGWDGTDDGRPTDLTRRRWQNFGRSGAKLIWGGEAVAVRHDGRANPNQLVLNGSTQSDLAMLCESLRTTHRDEIGTTDDLLVGLQLTHSGRFSRPYDKRIMKPRTLYRHSSLDPRCGIRDDSTLLSDDDLSLLIEDFIRTAKLAWEIGFAFVDVKHCHGYLGHEFLSGFDRPGRFGGSLDNRTRFLREIVAGIRAEAPGLQIGVRVSLYDFCPFVAGPEGVGVPVVSSGIYRYAFGGDGTGTGLDLSEPHAFLELLYKLGIEWVCSTAGSPYYNPHMQRPAAFPPSDGYQPPEDPLLGVARLLEATACVKAAHPELIVVGTGYSYLQEWLPNVGQSVIRQGGADFIGLGRMVLSYPEFPADVLAGRRLARKRICRTFSDCTTAPRNGLVSGCYPLDPFYKDRPERVVLSKLEDQRRQDQRD
jgi:NADPH2 dehydrogenase